MNSNLKTVLLTILTLSVFTLVIIELTGISSNSLNALLHKNADNKAATHPAGTADAGITDARVKLAAQMPKTTMEFYEKTFNFGKISADNPVKHIYKFKNTGTNPLIISKTDVSCGCTVPQFTDAPIPPGGEGEITVTFNPKGKSGAQHKNILVHSNAELEAVSIGFDADVK
jgi:hypothetical protein